jgi:6-phosphogluconate dehydrogenase
MQLGMVGLGRMGSNMVRRLLKAGHECVVYDRLPAPGKELETEGAIPADSLESFVSKLAKPRRVWVMLPAGEPTEESIAALANLMEPGDAIIDGGNSYFKDDIRRAEELKRKRIHFVDVGTSGGVWGLERGYCLMIGGEQDIVRGLFPIFKALAPGIGNIDRTPGREKIDSSAEEGFLHCGPVGSGHFVKMVHNGIEYGLMQAYAEGFEIFRNANGPLVKKSYQYDLNIADIAEVWRRGSVVGSWLLDLTAAALASDPQLDSYSGYVEDSGEGRWTVQAAIEEAVPAEVLSAALYTRFRSRQESPFSDKLLSAMRHSFGGHIEQKPHK